MNAPQTTDELLAYDHKAITHARIEMLPDWVREMIGR